MKIENVKIINHNNTINNADITLKDGKILSIIPKEGEGSKILMPGFIDTHTHGIGGHDFMDGKEATETITSIFPKFGVTSIYATIMTREKEVMLNSLKEISEAKSRGANILGIHAEGPFISLEKKGAHNPDLIIKGNERILIEQFNASQGMLKKITFSPETCDDDFIKRMIELKIMPSIGHSNASFKRTIEAIEMGSLHSTHLWNAMSGVQNRNPGMAEAVIYDDRVFAELITDFVHVDKETVLFTLKTKKPEHIILVTDSIRPAGLPDGESESGGIIIEKTGPKIVLKGTDTIAGSGATMYECVKNLIDLEIPLEDVVKMSSYNSAKSLNLENKGFIQEGMDADFVLMDQSYKIIKTFIAGKEY
ncbi:MAG: N-acetylglucosamine-6-phosphate deacetylase [Mycoplasmatales bacterium]|nr:N-acetylglucosamine-6-phosphate deacetylase [Mycoplasmatales bacterium]